MPIIKKHKLLCFGIILLGVFLLGIASVYAEDQSQDPGVTYEEMMADREAKLIELAERWAAQLGEGVEDLTRTLHSATTEELLEVDQAGSAEDVREALGDVDKDLVYTPVTPCIVWDTRPSFGGEGILNVGVVRGMRVHGTGSSLGPQGGSSSGCNAPRGEPRAVHLQFLAIDVKGRGNLKVSPYAGNPASGIGVNYVEAGWDLANAGTVKTAYNQGDDVQLQARFAACHSKGIVLGYYYPVDPTPLDAYSTSRSQYVANRQIASVYSPTCLPGYVATGGGCTQQFQTTQLNTFIASRPNPTTGTPTRWECQGENYASGMSWTAHVVCARIP